jgi:hypothetical protein
MAELLHANDSGVVIYVNVTDDGIALGNALDNFTTRTIRLRRPRTGAIVVITAVPTEVDPLDSVKKLRLTSGSDSSLSLTNVGNFLLPSSDYGLWQGEVQLGDMGWNGRSDPFEAFEVLPNLT